MSDTHFSALRVFITLSNTNTSVLCVCL